MQIKMFSPSSSDPLSMGPQKALETIGANLQKQYENWQPRVSIRLLLFPPHREAAVPWFQSLGERGEHTSP